MRTCGILLLLIGLSGCPEKQEVPKLRLENVEIIDLDAPRKDLPEDVRVALEVIDQARKNKK